MNRNSRSKVCPAFDERPSHAFIVYIPLFYGSLETDSRVVRQSGFNLFLCRELASFPTGGRMPTFWIISDLRNRQIFHQATQSQSIAQVDGQLPSRLRAIFYHCKKDSVYFTSSHDFGPFNQVTSCYPLGFSRQHWLRSHEYKHFSIEKSKWAG